tara:strand:+ start:25684 stop:26628 length:945 start_codon:yes stop_codon:yes gene_type:complete
MVPSTSDTCADEKEYGDIGNGVHLGISELLTLKRTSDSRQSLIFRALRLNGVPCLGIMLFLNRSTRTLELPGRPEDEYHDNRFLGHLRDIDLSPSVFYSTQGNKFPPDCLTDTHNLIWSPISEILNNKRIYDFSIEPEITKLFETHKRACYLFDDNGQVLPSPSVVYNGAYTSEIASSVGLGKSRSSPFASYGPNYYFGSYEYALRFAVTTLDGKSRTVGNKDITRVGTEGVFVKGGMGRYLIMEGLVQLGGQGTWEHCTNTVVDPKLDYLGAAFIVNEYRRILLVDYAWIDTSRVRAGAGFRKAYVMLDGSGS